MHIVVTLIRREFEVKASVEAAWAHLANVEQWPSWARHITKIELTPPGELTPTSQGLIHLKFGPASAFRVTEFKLHRNWKWVGGFLWLTVHYDHAFEPSTTGCKLTWTVSCEGFGASWLGRAFAAIYNRNLNAAIPRLIQELGQP